MLTSLYLSKPGTTGPPYTVEALNSYFISQHPCLLSSSVCCMNDYKRIYAVGAFEANITSTVGACGDAIQNANTVTLFNTAGSQSMVDNIFSAYPDSFVERISDGEVRLHIAQTDLSAMGLAKREPLANAQPGYMLTFFVGMTYFTLLPTNAISVSASQVQVQLAVSNTLTFSFASAQDYSFLKYITVSLIQTKWIDENMVQKHLQLVRVGLVLPSGMLQNMNTGLVPLSSIRFAVAQSLPDRVNGSAWTNPCFSADSSGLYDTTNAYGYHLMYQTAQEQTCAARQNLCANPTTATLGSGLVNFYFPIGDQTITPAMLASFQSPYFMFVYFQLSVLDSSGRVVVSNLFAKAQLNMLSLTSTCESVTAEVSLLSTTTIDIAVGLVGTQSDWNNTMRIFPDVTQSVRRCLFVLQLR